jgi:chaperonin GroES
MDVNLSDPMLAVPTPPSGVWSPTPAHVDAQQDADPRDLPVPALRPRGSRVLISPIELESTRDSGIFIPQTTQRRSNEGIVRAIGPGYYEPVEREVPDLEVGDRVLYLRWSGFEVNVDGEIFVSVNETDIVAIADEDAVVALGGDGVRE